MGHHSPEGVSLYPEARWLLEAELGLASMYGLQQLLKLVLNMAVSNCRCRSVHLNGLFDFKSRQTQLR